MSMDFLKFTFARVGMAFSGLYAADEVESVVRGRADAVERASSGGNRAGRAYRLKNEQRALAKWAQVG